jgi:hypothetical protein
MKKETAVMEAISIDESKRLIELETRIKAGVETFVEVGDALSEIKESRLYRADFPTFQAYCESKWNFTRRRAYQLIEAAEVRKALPANVKQCFTNPRQLNALAKLPKAKRAKAAKAIAKAVNKTGGRVTAKAVKTEVAKQLPRGGLCADAIRARDGEPETQRQSKPLPNPVLQPTDNPITLADFQKQLDSMESRIPADADHAKFGRALDKAATRQMNWGQKATSHV